MLSYIIKIYGIRCCRFHPAESAWFVAEDENKCTQTRTVWWRKRDGTGTLLR